MKNEPIGMLRGNLYCMKWACEDFIEALKSDRPLTEVELEILADRMANLQRAIERYKKEAKAKEVA